MARRNWGGGNGKKAANPAELLAGLILRKENSEVKVIVQLLHIDFEKKNLGYRF